MQVKCWRCGTKFTAQRRSARYCSDSCRVIYSKRGSIVHEEVTRVINAVAELCDILDGDRKHWGREVHGGAMEMHEAMSKLFARTDFLTQEELQR